MPDRGETPFESFLGPLSDAVHGRISRFNESDFAVRLWKREPSLWKDDEEHQRVASRRLGWLASVGVMQSSAADLRGFAAAARADGLKTAVLLGMGGSSLCPEVFSRIFGPAGDALRLLVLDTTDPASILAAEREADPASSLYLVSSKSGTTVETLSLYRHFRARLEGAGAASPGSHFVAITDPGSPLERLAGDEGFRHCFRNMPDIGGRYSALSFFGLVPAALLGMNLGRLLDRAARMASLCGPGFLPAANAGVHLGAILGEAALAGKDKLTLLLSPEISSFGYWLEQLVAESTGKEGKGILPVEGESPGPTDAYGRDRIVVYLRLAGGDNRATDATAASLRESAHPLVRLDLDDTWDLGGEFLRWEVATATAGAVLGVDPFDEPNVKESKDNTNRLLREAGDSGGLPPAEPLVQAPPLAFHVHADLASSLEGTVRQRGWPEGKTGLLAALLASEDPGDYVSLQAYLGRSAAHGEILSSIRTMLRDELALATTLGYGPRFLHSTGQYHKGGPPRGIFVQITADDARDLPVPGVPYSFGQLKAAQAQGDLEALAGRGRRALRVHITGDPVQGLKSLGSVLQEALVLVRRLRG